MCQSQTQGARLETSPSLPLLRGNYFVSITTPAAFAQGHPPLHAFNEIVPRSRPSLQRTAGVWRPHTPAKSGRLFQSFPGFLGGLMPQIRLYKNVIPQMRRRSFSDKSAKPLTHKQLRNHFKLARWLLHIKHERYGDKASSIRAKRFRRSRLFDANLVEERRRGPPNGRYADS